MQIQKDNLFHMLAHDLRNPLSGILGYLSLLEFQECGEGGERTPCSEYIKNSICLARRMGDLINDMLDVNRLENNSLPLRTEEVNLRELVEGSLFEHEVLLREKKLISHVETNENVSIIADKKLFIRVIGNILANSIRYSPEGGKLFFTIGNEKADAFLAISNQGPAIPDDLLERIFEKFYQAEAKSADICSGAGLGLAFCKLVVEAHGGVIRAENNADKGCRFTIRLPV